ncbi:MAG: hypothetical protein Q8Q02_01870 [Nocardioides sp.]|nr:hypothetical protein [Nocardioides sp.]
MDGLFIPRCPSPRGLVTPVPVDPDGWAGPTRGQARGPSWRRVGPGGYVPSTVVRTVEQRILEEWHNLPGSVVTGWAACRLWGAAYCDGLAPDGSERPVPLWVPKGRSVRPRPGRVVVRRAVDAGLVHRGRIDVLVPGAAAVEAAVEEVRRRGIAETVVLLDMVAAAGAALPEWISQALDRSPLHHRSSVRAALARCSERSCSPNETRMRLVWEDLCGLPAPLVNQEVFTPEGRFVARVDLLDPALGLVGEYDGAAHRTARRHARDVARESALRDLGLEVVRVVAGGLTSATGRAAAATLIRRGAARARTTGPGSWRLTGTGPRWQSACEGLREQLDPRCGT